MSVSSQISNKINRKHIIDGIKDSIPIALGYAPLGIALGIMANSIRLTWLGMMEMSVIVFAGSAQFICVNMLDTGAAMSAIIITTFFVNFRHFLMSTAYSPYFKDAKTWQLLLLSHGITDESFAVGINKIKRDPNGATITYMISLNTFAYLSWIFFTIIGVFLGDAIADYEKLGLNFALNAMFIGLIAMMITDKKSVLVCVLSGILSVGLLMLGLTSWNVIIAAIVASVGVVAIGEIK